MDKKKPVFEIHLENWNHGLHVSNIKRHFSYIHYILELTERHKVNVIIYTLEDWKSECPDDWKWLNERGFNIKSHGVHHYYDEKADRSPYWNQEGIPFPPSGGFFFRLLPVFYLKWAIKKSGIFWIHPHDLDENHPKLKNPIMNWKRHVGLKSAKAKLERLINEIDWHDPRT